MWPDLYLEIEECSDHQMYAGHLWMPRFIPEVWRMFRSSDVGWASLEVYLDCSSPAEIPTYFRAVFSCFLITVGFCLLCVLAPDIFASIFVSYPVVSLREMKRERERRRKFALDPTTPLVWEPQFEHENNLKRGQLSHLKKNLILMQSKW